MLYCALFCVHYSFSIVLMGEERACCFAKCVILCLMIGVRLLNAVPRACLQFVIVVFPDLTHYFELVVVVCMDWLSTSKNIRR